MLINSLDNELVEEIILKTKMKELYNDLCVVKRNFEIETEKNKKICKDDKILIMFVL